jgi:hypothetical protein
MRLFCIVMLAFASFTCSAQQAATPHAGSDWDHLQKLPAGVTLYIHARSHKTSCSFKSADADSITCTKNKDIAFQRSDVLTIKVSHRTRSALIGLAIGGGVGAGIGAAIGGCQAGNFCFVPRGAFAGVLGGAGAVVGTVTGAVWDFGRSTLYTAP